MTVLPKGKHDDQVDLTAQFLDWFKRPFPGQGIYDHYRRLAQATEQAGTAAGLVAGAPAVASKRTAHVGIVEAAARREAGVRADLPLPS